MIKLGLPTGSLQDATLSLMQKAGYMFSLSRRSYSPKCNDPRIQAVMLRAQEIAKYVERGVLDAGLTGRDWIEESGADVVEISELVYAKTSLSRVRWVLAVPADSAAKCVADLEGKRIATEAVNLTRRYLQKNGVNAEVEFSWGATEIKAPRWVDAIVEITETGASLAANNLRIIDTVLESSTRLIANRTSYADADKKGIVDNLAMLLRGALNATDRVGLKLNAPRDAMDTIRNILPAMKSLTVLPLLEGDWVALETMVDEETVREVIPKLKEAGARDIVEYSLNKVIF